MPNHIILSIFHKYPQLNASSYPTQQETIKTSQKRHTFEILPIDYAKVIEDPITAAKEIGAFIGQTIAPQAMAEVVDPSLYRTKG